MSDFLLCLSGLLVLCSDLSANTPLLLSLQYYYNSHTQQYMYWDGEKRTYVPAPSQTDSASAADSASLDASSASKDKKDKPKTKTAQQVDMHVYLPCLNLNTSRIVHSCLRVHKVAYVWRFAILRCFGGGSLFSSIHCSPSPMVSFYGRIYYQEFINILYINLLKYQLQYYQQSNYKHITTDNTLL